MGFSLGILLPGTVIEHLHGVMQWFGNPAAPLSRRTTFSKKHSLALADTGLLVSYSDNNPALQHLGIN